MASLSNTEIAKTLLSLAQLLSVQKENPFKIKAYRRAAKAISTLPESIDELARTGADLTAVPGIGKGISGTIREIVQRVGTLDQLEDPHASVGQTVAALSEYPLLDPKRVERIYKKLNISSVDELKDRLERSEIAEMLGAYTQRHVRQGLTPTKEILLCEAHHVVRGTKDFLQAKFKAERAEAAGDYRRHVEVIRDLSFVVQIDDFETLVKRSILETW